MKKRSRKRRISPMAVLLAAVLCVLLLVGAFLAERYTPGSTWADLEKIYAGTEGEAVVILNHQKLEEKAVTEDGMYYLSYTFVISSLNTRFYASTAEQQILYTLPEGNAAADFSGSVYVYDGQETKLQHPVSIERDGVLYLSMEYVAQFTDLRYSGYEDPGRLYVDTQWGTEKQAVLSRDTQVRYRGGIKSDILTEVQKGDQVTVLQELQKWVQVRTQDGHIGYVQKKALDEVYEVQLKSDFQAPLYPGVSAEGEGDIFLIWHDLYTKSANSTLKDMMKEEEGVTVISPTWFSLSGHQGGYTSIADSAYVKTAHDMGLEVWIRLDNFDTATYTKDALEKTENRRKLIEGMVSETVSLGADGINLDFEAVPKDAGEVYVQFMRELSVACHQVGLVFSVDDYIPSESRAHYNLQEQAVFADYVIIMGYTEHWEGSGAGSNASIGFTELAIERALEIVPKEKLIHAVPFFTRVWKETEADADTANARNDGNSVYEYYTLEVVSCSMRKPWELFAQYGVTPQWQEELGQYYGEYEADGSLYRIWVEDPKSIEEKMKLIAEADLAGCGAWKLGLEDPAVWSVVSSYLEK